MIRSGAAVAGRMPEVVKSDNRIFSRTPLYDVKTRIKNVNIAGILKVYKIIYFILF